MLNETRIAVLRGRPDETELAAVTAVLLALARRSEPRDEAARAVYADWTVKGGPYRSPVAWPGP
jgi:hypothetical protein